MFKVSLPSTHSNISSFCIRFQALLTHTDYLWICVCVCVNIRPVSFSISVCLRFTLILHRMYIFPLSICSQSKETPSLRRCIFHLSMILLTNMHPDIEKLKILFSKESAEQNQSGVRVNVWLTLIRWSETRLQIKDNVAGSCLLTR